ncbi:integrin alpha [Rhodococcus zopfii]|uniref:integrin alpha n=1 Tax=Rhodococcus zopfii TaxID=43772 RepID=UPI003528A87A
MIEASGSGAARRDRSGWAVAGAGDVTGDGLDDVLVGAPRADNRARKRSGSTYVVSGPPATLTVRARPKAKKVKRNHRFRLVRSIEVGPNQKVRVKVAVRPKTARASVKVGKTQRGLVVRTRNTPARTRIRIRVESQAPGRTAAKWVRSWRVR